MRKISQKLLVMFSLMMLSLAALSQNVVTGKATDSKDGSPAAGVTVTVKGTSTRTQTKADGTFSITAPSTATLVFTYVGFASQEIEVGGNASINVSLVQVNQQLSEVVVVAYGTRRKSDLTGSVTAVSSKDFQKGNIASTEQLLQGKVAGLQITTGGGSAGGGSTIRIRGGASLNASNDPLIVIDGVPVENNAISGSANLLNTINTDDIESVSVLKDASATALYGSRASNGVIIITTKKGGRGKVVFNFNTQVSLGMVGKKIDVLTGNEIRDIVNADAIASGSNTYKNLLGTANTDWQDEIFQNAFGNNNNISASGTVGKIPFRISLGYLTQSGTLKTNTFNRLSAAINVSPKLLNDHLSFNINLKGSNTHNRFADEGAIGSAVAFDPTQSVMSGTGKYGDYWEWLDAGSTTGLKALSTRNPVAMLDLRHNKATVNRFIGNVQMDYKLHWLPDLHILLNVGMDWAAGSGDDITDSTAATQYATKGRMTHYKQSKQNTLFDAQLFYTKDLKKINSKLDILVGHSYQDFYTNEYNYESYGQDGVLIPGTTPTFATNKPQNRLESYIGRINLTLANKYLITGSVRRDASSRFSKDNRVGYFPAAAVAWKLKEEIFKNNNMVSDLKLRFGWGITGQQDGIGNYGYLPVYSQSTSTAQYQFGNTMYGFLRPNAYDPNIKWETTTTTNFGLDFGFLQNRISGSFDYYMKKTEDLLSTVPVAAGANFNIELLTNVGNIENKGFEFTLNTVPVKKKNLTWEFGFNFTYNKTEITNLLKQPDPNFKGLDVSTISGGTGNNIGKFTVGYSPFAYYMFKQVYDVNGIPVEGAYVDLNGDGTITDADRYYYKKPAPDYLLGVSTQLLYKKFSLGLAGHGSFGNYLYNNFNSNNATLRQIKNPINFIGNASADYLFTRFTNNRYLSDYYIENASFFRLDNINLGYNFGKVMRSRASLRIAASVQNVFVITKYKGGDPENSSSSGVDNNIYPRPRIFSLGANLDF